MMQQYHRSFAPWLESFCNRCFRHFLELSGEIRNQLPLVLAHLTIHPFVGAFPSLCHPLTTVVPPYISKKQNKNSMFLNHVSGSASGRTTTTRGAPFRIPAKGTLGFLVLRWLTSNGVEIKVKREEGSNQTEDDTICHLGMVERTFPGLKPHCHPSLGRYHGQSVPVTKLHF